MEDNFNESLKNYFKNKTQILIPTKCKYEEMIAIIQKSSAQENKTIEKEEKNLIRRYQIRTEATRTSIRTEEQTAVLFHLGDKETENAQRVVYQEELFALLQKSHEKLGHGGQNVMWRDLRDYYAISKEIIGLYLALCEQCQLKKGRPKKGLVVKPILSEDHNSRCQMDLIDLQSCPADNYKHIMVYQDHLTKFVILRALQRKCAEEVAAHLNEIFATMGAPRILQSDNGREFVNGIIKNLLLWWPECKIVHGRPRHSQSQGSVERCNLDIQRILSTYLRDHPNHSWPQALPMVQAIKNRRFHKGIGRSPFEAMFGRKMVMGNEDGRMPSREERGLPPAANETEELFPSLCITDNETEERPDQNWGEIILAAKSGDPTYFPKSDEGEIEDEDIDPMPNETAELNEREKSIYSERAASRASQQKQADKMLEASNRRFGTISVGQSVRIPIDAVDRPKLGQPNLLGIVLDINERGQYQIGTRDGRLPHRYERNQLEPCESDFIHVEDVPDKETTFRAAVGAESSTGTQGHKHCMCTSGCNSRKCACRKALKICNSRCHHGNNCNNKNDEY